MNWNRIIAIAFGFLLVNSGWLWAFPGPNLFYVANVVMHLVVGVVLLGTVWKIAAPARYVLLLCGALGLVLAYVGALKQYNWIIFAHGSAGFVGAALVWRHFRQRWIIGALAAALALPLVAWLRPVEGLIVNPTTAPLSMLEEGGGQGGPFFPSSSNTTSGETIPAGFFLESKQCGECHQDAYEQWSSSAHHFSSFNNQFYRKSIEYMQDTVGVEASKWCAGCHDHAMFFNGRFDRPVKEQIDTPEAQAGLGCMSCHAIVHVPDTMGNGGFVIEYPALHELATSQNSVVRVVQKYLTETAPEGHRRAFMKPFMRQPEFCASCHKVHLDQPVNDYRWLRGFNEYDSWQASGVSGHGARSFYYPEKPQDCADCHMPLVPSDDPGNVDGFVHSHRFPAANTALAHVNKDAKQLRATEEFLKNDIVSIDIFAAKPAQSGGDSLEMRRRADQAPQAATSFAVGEESDAASAPVVIREVGEIAAPLDRAASPVQPGQALRIDVVVRTRSVGHFFPGGTVDSVDCWIELTATDADGREVFLSGAIAEDGSIDEGAHFYRSVQLDERGNPINKRNAFQTRSLLYAQLIPPGAADVAHYLIDVPADVKGPIELSARLQFRKFSHYYIRFAYAGEPGEGEFGKGFDDRPFRFDPADIPENVSGDVKDRIPVLPVTTLAQSELTLAMAADPSWEYEAVLFDYERWNDYGIGLLLQGDIKGAQFAFQRVTEANPDFADGWLNIGRALIQEGQTEAAREFVEKALELAPELARTQYFYGLIHKAAGEFDEALEWLGRARSSYPKDRVVLNQIARIFFLQRRFGEAISVLDEVSRIDPEDLQMHYARMLCYRGLGDSEKADYEEKLFLRFKADESSQTKTARIRRLSPELNNERQAIHEHTSVQLERRPDTRRGQ